jgi:hypothetical protein
VRGAARVDHPQARVVAQLLKAVDFDEDVTQRR